jgi:putative hydrolase of the HAD superfamily
MSLPPFDAALFDLDDTLHDDTNTYRAAALRAARDIAWERGVAAEPLYEAYVRGAESFWADLGDEHLSLKLSGVRERLWSGALAAVGIEDADLAARAASAYNRYRADGLELFPGVLELLSGLRDAGCRTALITNGFAETHREKIALLRLERAFDAVVLADEVGMVKPDPRIFLHACALVGAAPERSVMVGDRYDRDIFGAIQAGLATVYLDVRNEGVPSGSPAPAAAVTSFEGVTAALARSLEPLQVRNVP